MKTLGPKEIIDACKALDPAGRQKVAKALGKLGKKPAAASLTEPNVPRYNPGSMGTATLNLEPATVGKKIRRIRKEKGLSLVELAERAGITHPALSQIERDQYTPRPRTLICIALGLGVRVRELSPIA